MLYAKSRSYRYKQNTNLTRRIHSRYESHEIVIISTAIILFILTTAVITNLFYKLHKRSPSINSYLVLEEKSHGKHLQNLRLAHKIIKPVELCFIWC